MWKSPSDFWGSAEWHLTFPQPSLLQEQSRVSSHTCLLNSQNPRLQTCCYIWIRFSPTLNTILGKLVCPSTTTFLSEWEQRKKDWSSWEVIQQWHKLELENIQVFRKDRHKDSKASEAKEQASADKQLVHGVEKGQIKAAHICLKYQNDNCALEHDHQAPNGGKNSLSHICAFCFLKLSPAVSQSHSARNCKKRGEKQSFQKRGGQKDTPS